MSARNGHEERRPRSFMTSEACFFNESGGFRWYFDI